MTAAVGGPQLDFMGSLVTEDGRFWAQVATGDQIVDAVAVLDAGVRRHWLGRARGYSKTTDVAAMALTAMVTGLIPPGGRGYAAAADGAQAGLLVDAARGFVSSTPGLDGIFTIDRTRIIGPCDTTVEILTSDASSACGLRGVWFVVDELCQWPDTPSARSFYDAISTSWPKLDDCRVTIITTAGDPAHWSRAIYDHAFQSDTWRVSDLHGPRRGSTLSSSPRRRLGFPSRCGGACGSTSGPNPKTASCTLRTSQRSPAPTRTAPS